MFDVRSIFRGSVFRAKQQDGDAVRDDQPKSVSHSRREKTVRSRRLYAPIEFKPLSEEEARRLPVANRYSA
jgi:hypothetical protein